MRCWNHDDLSDAEVRRLIQRRRIMLAGNRSRKVMGRLDCSSGRRMHRKNRILFPHAFIGTRSGYRPCGHCCRNAHWRWKRGMPWVAALLADLEVKR